MFTKKIIIITTVLLAFAGLTLAQGGAQGQPPAGEPPQGQSQGAPQDNRSTAKFDYGPVFEAIDKNKDGKILKDEWMAAGLSQHTYDNLFIKMLDVNKDLSVTKEEFTASSPQFEVDTNKDGKVSLEEYVAANNGRAALMSSGGASAPPPTNHGGAGGEPPQGGAGPAATK